MAAHHEAVVVLRTSHSLERGARDQRGPGHRPAGAIELLGEFLVDAGCRPGDAHRPAVGIAEAGDRTEGPGPAEGRDRTVGHRPRASRVVLDQRALNTATRAGAGCPARAGGRAGDAAQGVGRPQRRRTGSRSTPRRRIARSGSGWHLWIRPPSRCAGRRTTPPTECCRHPAGPLRWLWTSALPCSAPPGAHRAPGRCGRLPSTLQRRCS